jgi:hypothetical protein
MVVKGVQRLTRIPVPSFIVVLFWASVYCSISRSGNRLVLYALISLWEVCEWVVVDHL